MAFCVWLLSLSIMFSRFISAVAHVSTLLFKLSYIADFYGRTKNREIEYVLKKHITEFEKQYGVIPVPDDIADEE